MASEVAKMELDEEGAAAATQETPRVVLSGYRPDLTYTEVTSSNPEMITVMTEVDNHEFHGVGDSFVIAAERAALEVITYLYSTEEIVIGVDRYNSLMSWKQDKPAGDQESGSQAKTPGEANVSALMIFNQLYQKNNPEWIITQLSSMPSRYRVVLKILEQTFEAEEASKKVAKQKVATDALTTLRGVSVDSLTTLLTPSPSRKRRSEDGRRLSRDINAPTPPKRKRRPDSSQGPPYIFSEAKNRLQILNEFRRGLDFIVVTQDGPIHAPRIVMKVIVDDKTFEAEDTSKQKAKTQLASAIVEHFVEEGQIKLVPAPEGSQPTTPVTPANKPSPQVVGAGAGGKTPLMMLYELAKAQPPCEMEEFEENKTKRFIAKYTIAGKTYEGEGLSKQRAKHKAAEVILRDVYGLQMNGSSTNGEGADGDGSESKDVRWMQFADRVRKAIMEKWRDTCQTLSEENAKRKVIAGIVVTIDLKHEPMEDDGEPAVDHLPDLFSHEDLICMTTGTKCLNGEFMSENGISINDCHAEILSARCLRVILYRHIEKLAKGESSILLEKRSDDGIGLRPGVRFHLYISTAPCGDSRIFCPHELGAITGDNHPGRKSRGLLRTKIESGEGTIPVPIHGLGLQTFDGVIQGERLLTMSCSDKLCQWNVVGMQGALLSRILAEPIYFDTIIVGSVFVESHLDRALYQRVAEVENVPVPFRANRPTFLVTTDREERMPRKSPGISVVWIADDGVGSGELEVISASRGKLEDNKPSNLCKRAMYTKFRAIEKNYPDVIVHKSKVTPVQLYAEAKAFAAEYMESKRLVQQHLKSNGSGVWIRRPMEQDLFELTE